MTQPPSDSVAEEEKPDSESEIPGFEVAWENPEGEMEHGPLTVLWQLIETYRVDVFDISLQKITDDFINFINHARDLKIELVSSFAVMAARLLYYKSKALLPDPGFEEPESESRLPPELVQQLLEYRKYQLAAEKLGELRAITSGMYTRESVRKAPAEDSSEWLDVNLVDLIRAYADVLSRAELAEQNEPEMEVSMDEFSVEDKVTLILEMLNQAVSFAFDDLFQLLPVKKKGDIIATFLAILELVRQGAIILQQKAVFGEIHIFKKAAVVR